LARADDGDPMAPVGKPVHQPPQCHGDPIDFRSVGFGDEGEVQGVCPQAGAIVVTLGEGRMAAG
jgi:hypothetical protein